jgi:pyruvate-formate lyase-activating enzyme
MGGYGKTLDVKLTDACNGKCPFCIERGGKKSKAKDCDKLISAVNTLDPEAVLVLGGEPFQYPKLVEFLQGIKKDGRKVFLTTNGVALSEMSGKEIVNVAKCLTSINISLQHYDMDKHAELLGQKINLAELKVAIDILRENGCKVRINALLLKGYLDNFDDCLIMVKMMQGADWIRFSEVQNFPKLFVDARDIFPGITSNPFTDGCEEDVNMGRGLVIKCSVKVTCGLIDSNKPMPKTKDTFTKATVLYPDTTVSKGWIASEPSCHGRSARGCHGHSNGRGCN